MIGHPLGDGAELRPLEPWQAEEFYTHLVCVRDHIAPWVPFATRVWDVEAARALLQRYADEQARDGGRFYGIWLDEVLVGGTLFRVFDPQMGVCELGVWLSPHVTGRGLVTRAATRMIDWAVHSRGIQRVEWWCDVENKPSQAVAQRLGMSLDGVMRSLFELGGSRRDIQVWSVLASEWGGPRA